MAVLEEQQRRIREAMASKPAPSEDNLHNLELKAMKAMGAMEEGEEVLGTGAEVNLNLDSQVLYLDTSSSFPRSLSICPIFQSSAGVLVA